ncbi:hypothetical protein Q8F55_006772 [Vanrija albida]|uniref:Biogenesis of lysosome-related organelles complex 1 subunit 1 n=1 Tax=Vanrija albida TaxID=181172 RepID=A0ABR3PY51_9TREE
MARKRKSVSSGEDSSDDHSSDDSVERLMAKGTTRRLLDAKRLADEIMGHAEGEAAKVATRYSHAIQTTHKTELEARYTQLRQALLAQDNVIASARHTIANLSADLHSLVDDTCAEIQSELAQASKITQGCMLVIDASVQRE